MEVGRIKLDAVIFRETLVSSMNTSVAIVNKPCVHDGGKSHGIEFFTLRRLQKAAFRLALKKSAGPGKLPTQEPMQQI